MKKRLLDKEQINSIIKRLSCEIIEGHKDINKIALIGIRTRGEIIANRVTEYIEKKMNVTLKTGVLDVTFHRDDFLTNLGSPKIGPSDITLDLNDLNIVLIDDVFIFHNCDLHIHLS